MITPFEDLLHEMGASLGMTLHTDSHGACCLKLKDKLRVQIEPDKKEERVMIAAFIAELNPGRFRENVLKEALRVNTQNVVNGQTGAILGFSARHNQLACYTSLPFEGISGEKLVTALSYLIEQSLLWFDALQNGQAVPPGILPNYAPPTPFGIRP
jgi:hypothetical protein